jgi:hypothetical protein
MSNRSIFIVTVLLDRFAQAKMSINAFWVNFYRMFKVLGGSLSFTHISQ